MVILRRSHRYVEPNAGGRLAARAGRRSADSQAAQPARRGPAGDLLHRVTPCFTSRLGLARRTYPDPGDRTAFFASLDLAVNGLALAIQLLGTRPIVQRFGPAIGLALVDRRARRARRIRLLANRGPPGCHQIVNRAGDFSLIRPGREMIYTTVDPESRYKAKNFIDTAVYRGNDALMAGWSRLSGPRTRHGPPRRDAGGDSLGGGRLSGGETA